MHAKHYLTVSNRNNLASKKQKSFESYDSTSSIYSQPSDCSDLLSPKSDESERSTFFETAPISPDLNSNSSYDSKQSIQKSGSLWKKTVSSFRSYRGSSGKKRHKSLPSAETSGGVKTECGDIDPVYNLLKCAAVQRKGHSPVNCCHAKAISHDRSSSIPINQLALPKNDCMDASCPCKTPEKLPIIKKEDLGQQAKRDLKHKDSRKHTDRRL